MYRLSSLYLTNVTFLFLLRGTVITIFCKKIPIPGYLIILFIILPVRVLGNHHSWTATIIVLLLLLLFVRVFQEKESWTLVEGGKGRFYLAMTSAAEKSPELTELSSPKQRT